MLPGGIVKVDINAVFEGLCPACGQDIDVEAIMQGGVCSKCKSSELQIGGRRIVDLPSKLKRINEMFESVIGIKMWDVQEVWAKRALTGESFAVVAPTGIGKTTFGIIYSLYTALNGGKSYIVVPTGLLGSQIASKIKSHLPKLGLTEEQCRVLVYHSALRAKEKRQFDDLIRKGEYSVLITTERFVADKFDLVSNRRFNFVFIDDVDRFLKASKNIDKVLLLLGIPSKLIDKTMDYIKKRETTEDDETELNDLYSQLKETTELGQIVVSGATMRSGKTKRIRLFKRLMGFEVGSSTDYVRNIKDLFDYAGERRDSPQIVDHVVKHVKRLGSGVLLYVPAYGGKDLSAELGERLTKEGFKTYVYESLKPNVLDKFNNGELDVLIGVASARSPLSRGIDLPESVRYVMFAGVPRIESKLDPNSANPLRLLMLMRNVRHILPKEEQYALDKLSNRLKKFWMVIGNEEKLISKSIAEGTELEGFHKNAKAIIVEAQHFVKKLLAEGLVEKIRNSTEVIVTEKEGGIYLIVPDPSGYIQASGRGSRLYAGGVTRGMSLLVVDEPKAFESLKRRIKWISEDIEFADFKEQNLKEIMKGIDEDREAVSKALAGEIPPETFRNLVKVATLIVESPTKARTISRLFGSPSRRMISGATVYETCTGQYILNIMSTGGHLYDLVTDRDYMGINVKKSNGDINVRPIYGQIKRCNKCSAQFVSFDECPKCGSRSLRDKDAIIAAMRKLAFESNIVMIGTDPDREGEKIAYDILCTIFPYAVNSRRMEFHEITKRGLTASLENLREIDFLRVKAQVVRRIEDRWLGFLLSQSLWKQFSKHWLSAGRVQTPVLGWVIERTKAATKRKWLFKITLNNGFAFTVIRDLGKKRARTNCREMFEQKYTAKEESRTEVPINPFPPYTTDSLLRDSVNRYKLTAIRAMQLMQDLFEFGFITYHRTDATTVSGYGMGIARIYLEEKYPNLVQLRPWQSTGAGIQGAHECIRPTRPVDSEALQNLVSSGTYKTARRMERIHYLVYDMIFKRFIASQMKSSKVLKQKVTIISEVLHEPVTVEATVKILEAGFTTVTGLRTHDELATGEYTPQEIVYTSIPAAALYTEGELISEMKARGIGRPSTYAKTVTTIVKGGYAFQRSGKLIPTTLGKQVHKYLTEQYGYLVSEELSRDLEGTLDKLESGETQYQDAINRIYSDVQKITPVIDYSKSNPAEQVEPSGDSG